MLHFCLTSLGILWVAPDAARTGLDSCVRFSTPDATACSREPIDAPARSRGLCGFGCPAGLPSQLGEDVFGRPATGATIGNFGLQTGKLVDSCLSGRRIR